MTKRQPKGTPVGGQFAPDRKPGGGDLASPLSELPAPNPTSQRGVWDIEHASKPKPVDRGNGVISTTFSVAGEPSAQTDVAARVVAYPKPENLDETITAAIESGEPVTVLKVGEGMFGGRFPQIIQGKLFQGSRGLGFLPTGKRTQGFTLKGPLDVIPGNKPAAVAELNRRWYDSTGIPPTEPLTIDALRSASEENPIAVLYTHPGFGDGPTPGCVWYIDYYEAEDDDPDNGIAGGYLYCPPESGLFSEHGSTYAKDILKSGALVSTKPKVNFEGMTKLPDDDRSEAYRQIFERRSS